MRYLIFLTILLAGSPVFAATGDILYSNCAGGTCTAKHAAIATSDSSTGWVRTVETNGCYSGNCLKLVGTVNTNANAAGYGAGNTSITNTSVNGKTEITISQWVKYNKDVNSISGGNMKLDRAYSGTKFYATSIAPSFSNDFYMGAMKGTMKNKASWFDMVESTQNSSYPVNNGNGTYSVDGYIKGKFTSGGFGTSWVKVTKWLKLPTTDTGYNGAVKVWIGDDLLYEMINVGAYSPYPIGTTFKSLSMYPSSEATEPFEHWTDEFIIYEGYVPPGPQTPVDGECGAADGAIYTSLTSSSPNLCSTGAVGSFVEGPPTATWSCLGYSGGTTDNCSATITPDTCQDNDALCSNVDDCLFYYPSNSFCVNDDPQCHPGDCISVGSLTNFNLLSQEDCGNLGLFYWGGTCNTVSQPTNLTTGINLLANPNLLDWTSTLPDNYTSYIPGNIEKTFLGARMFNGATLNPSYSLKVDTTYTAVYNLMTVTGHGKIWSDGFPEDYLSSAAGTIIHQFTTPSVMSDRKLYVGSDDESSVEVNNFRLYESTKDTEEILPGVPTQRYKIGGAFVKEVTNN